MALNISAIQDELKPGLAAVEGRYKMVPLELQDVFTTRQSYMNQEFTTYMRHPGVAAIKVDGQSVVYDNQSGQRYKYNMRPIGAGLGYIMTRNFLADNLYRSEFDPMNLGLQDSMREFWNIQSAYLFNTATTYDTSSGGTGQPLLSVSHPTDAGTFANTSSTPQSLSEASLLAAEKAIPTTFLNQAGLHINVKPETLMVSWNNIDVAKRLELAELRPGTAQNDPNIVHDLHGPIKVKVSRFLNSTAAPGQWYLLTNVKGFICFEREPFEMDMFPDFDSDNLKVKCFERKGYFWNDPRSVYGQMATQ